MKQTLSILFVTIAIYIILCMVSYFIFPAINNFVLSRATSGVMGVVSWAIAMFVVKKIIKIPA